MDKTIKTDRLEIKPYREADRKRMAELLTNSEIRKTFMIPEFKTEEDLLRMIEKLHQFSLADNHFERGIYLEDSLIGFVNDVEIVKDVIELGYMIHPAFHNKGYATEMFQAVTAALLQEEFSTVIAGAFADNTASIRVMQKCGMKKISKEEDITYQGKKQHCIYYAISKESAGRRRL
ncbi:GNAT family N-acetyltransferase [Eisenbergiella sp.]